MDRLWIRPKRTGATRLLLFLLACLAAAIWTGSSSAGLHAQLGRLVLVVQVQPAAAEIPIGRSQLFQLVDANGRLVPSDEWSVSDPAIADLTLRDGRAELIGRRDGIVTLSNARGARSDTIRVRALAAGPLTPRWSLRPVDGRFAKVLPASSGSQYFYEDRGRVSAHVRAVGEDGLQRWQWPPPQNGGIPELLAADRTGGALVLVKTRDVRELVSLDADGQERWRVPSPGLSERGLAVTASGGVVFVSDNGTTRRLIGIDAHTGRQELAALLDAGQATQRNFSVQSGGLVCTPGVVRTDSLPLRATPVVAGPRGTVSLAYAEWAMSADAGGCGAGARLAVTDIRVQAQQRLVLLDVDARFAVTRQILDDGERTTQGNERGVPMVAPLPALLAPGDGTLLLPVRRVSRDWLTGDESPLGEFMTRLAGDARRRLYQVVLPPLAGSAAATAGPSLVALQASATQRTAFISRGSVLLALDAATGQERWRYPVARGSAEPLMSLSGETVIVRNEGRYTLVDTGQPVQELEPAQVLFGLRRLPTVDPALPAVADARTRLTLRR